MTASVGGVERDRGEEAWAWARLSQPALRTAVAAPAVALGQAEHLPGLLQSRLRLLELPEGGAGAHLGHRCLLDAGRMAIANSRSRR